MIAGGGDPRRAGACGSERGSALLPAVILSVLFLSLATAALVAVPSSLRSITERTARSKARYMASGGAALAARQIEKGRTGAISSLGWTVRGPGQLGQPLSAAELAAAPEGSFTVVTTTLSNGSVLVEARARWGIATPVVREVLRPVPATPFRHAAAGMAGVRFRGSVFSDAYDSRAGAYASQAVNTWGGRAYAKAGGAIASNGSITLAGGAVMGSVSPGIDGTLNAGSTVISGSTTPLSGALKAPEIVFAAPAKGTDAVGTTTTKTLKSTLDSVLTGLAPGAPAPSPSSIDLASGSLQPGGSGGGLLLPGSSLDLSAGTYDLTTVRVVGATVRVRGSVTIRASTRFEIGAGGSIVIEPGASLTVYAEGAVVLGGDGIRNLAGPTVRDASGAKVPEGDPTKLSIFIAAGAGDEVRIATGTPLFGGIYAPGRPVEIASDLTLFGSVIADSFTGEGSASLHFDEAMLEAASGPEKRLEAVARWSSP